MVIEFSKIMVGIDGSEESIKAVEFAISMAKIYRAELIAVHVLTSDIGYIYSSPGCRKSPLDDKGDHVVS